MCLQFDSFGWNEPPLHEKAGQVACSIIDCEYRESFKLGKAFGGC